MNGDIPIDKLFVSIFHLFEAGIANAISGFKLRKIFPSEVSYLTNRPSTTNYIILFSETLFDLKYAENCVYKGIAGQAC